LHLCRGNSLSCDIDPACLPAPLLWSSLPLTVTPFLHHQSDPTMPCDGLAGLVRQQYVNDEVVANTKKVVLKK